MSIDVTRDKYARSRKGEKPGEGNAPNVHWKTCAIRRTAPPSLWRVPKPQIPKEPTSMQRA